MATLTCPCGTQAEYPDRAAHSIWGIGIITGFMPVPELISNVIIYLCPTCYAEAHLAALQIRAIVGTNKIYLPNLMQLPGKH